MKPFDRRIETQVMQLVGLVPFLLSLMLDRRGPDGSQSTGTRSMSGRSGIRLLRCSSVAHLRSDRCPGLVPINGVPSGALKDPSYGYPRVLSGYW